MFSMVLVGFDNYIPISKITGVFPYNSSRLKTEVTNRRKKPEEYKQPLFDCTKGNTIETVITLEDGSYVLSSVHPKTIVKRIHAISDEISKTNLITQKEV